METNFEKVLGYVNSASGTMNRDEAVLAICMLIDTISARENEDATEIAEMISGLVKQVNSDMGAYQLP